MPDKDQQENVFDSNLQHLGNVYAKALFGATEKAGNTKEVVEQFDSFVDDVVAKLPQLEATLCSPRLPYAEKAEMLDKAFRGKMAAELLNFLKVVATHGRFDCLRAIRGSLRDICNEAQGIIEVSLRTAEPLTDELLGSIVSRLKVALDSDIVVRAQVDPDLIGGLVVRVGDTVFDGSVANRLVQLRTTAVAQTVQEIRQSLDRFVLAE